VPIVLRSQFPLGYKLNHTAAVPFKCYNTVPN